LKNSEYLVDSATAIGKFTGYAPRIGSAGWNIPRDSAHYFDTGKNHLGRYARLFNACEINSSFYRPHKIETWERWRDSVPANFRFAVKAPRTITHDSELNCGSNLLAPFLRQVSILEDKLGPILFQLPPSLQFYAASARRFLAALRERYSGDVVWEARHSSWFALEVDDLLREYKVAQVAADPPCVPLAAMPGGHSSLVYFRLHGSPRRYYSSYADDFLNRMAAQMADSAVNGQVWCIFDNTASGSAIPNAIALREKLGTGS
jgi:uncharacterized protein YecE (DUF72 family)